MVYGQFGGRMKKIVYWGDAPACVKARLGEGCEGETAHIVVSNKITSGAEWRQLFSFVNRGGTALLLGDACLTGRAQDYWLMGAKLTRQYPAAHLPSTVGEVYEAPVDVLFSNLKPPTVLATLSYGTKALPLAWQHAWGKGHVVCAPVYGQETIELLWPLFDLPMENEVALIDPPVREKTGKSLLIAGGPTGFHPFNSVMEAKLKEAFPTITDVVQTLDGLTLETLLSYDCVVLYCAPLWGQKGDGDFVPGFVEYLLRGGATCNVHILAAGAVPELAQIFGGKFRMHPPYNRYEMMFLESDITQKGVRFTLEDEMHQLILEQLNPMQVLCACLNDDHTPYSRGPVAHQDIYGKNGRLAAHMAWRLPFFEGKIAYACPGHNVSAFENETYMNFLQTLHGWLVAP